MAIDTSNRAACADCGRPIYRTAPGTEYRWAHVSPRDLLACKFDGPTRPDPGCPVCKHPVARHPAMGCDHCQCGLSAETIRAAK